MKNQKLKIKRVPAREKKGFTLIETLVAITLLVIAITGPLQIAANALFSSFYARDEITSYYLAVEAIEYIKNSRDTLFMSDIFGDAGSNSNWLGGLDACISDGTGDGCYLKTKFNFNPESPDTSIVACEGECPKLLYNSSDGLWGYDDGEETKFTRKTEIILLSDDGNSAQIKVQISWPSRGFSGGDKTFELSTVITNWERV